MKKILIAAAAAATLAGAAGTAHAQSWAYNNAIDNRQNVIRERIANGERAGTITVDERQMLLGELRQIRQQERYFRASRGIDRREFQILSQRLDRLHYRVDREARDRQDYRMGYGYGRDYDRNRGW